MGYTHAPPTKQASSRWLKLKLEPRYIIVLTCFLATFTAYVERVGFSIAFTSMAKEAGVDEARKGTVLSAFYWGYGVSQVNRRAALGPWSAAGRGAHPLHSSIG
jgi:ACS family sodium-dependent inorganic phosphate cotransporter